MGFSTSGAVVVILIGVLIAVSVIVPTIFSVGASSGEAFSTQGEQLREQVNTNIEIESFEMVVNESGDIIEPPMVNVTNTGSRTLSVDATDAVIVGEYYPVRSADKKTTSIVVDGMERNDSNAWIPGSYLKIKFTQYQIHEEIDDSLNLEDFEENASVKITTERGIADTAELTVTEESAGETE